MIYYIALFLYIIFIFLVTIIVHELGHYLYIRLVLGQKPRIKWENGNIGIYYKSNIRNIHKLNIAWWGYAFGFISIFFFTGDGDFFLLFIFLYSVGSSGDLKIIYNLLRKRKTWQEARNILQD